MFSAMHRLLLPLLLMMAGMAAAAQQPAGYDVASIRENTDVTDKSTHIYGSAGSVNVRATNLPLRQLLQEAYHLPESRIVGIPNVLKDKRFNIEARVDETREPTLKAMSADEVTAEKRRLLQALLAERFHLLCHAEGRELPHYELAVAKGGPKLKAAAGGRHLGGFYGRISAERVTMATFANVIALRMNEPVVDATGLAGEFDLELNYTPPEGPARLNGSPIPDPPPSIFTAIEEQLGLQLRKSKAPIEVLVVDRVEMPTAN